MIVTDAAGDGHVMPWPEEFVRPAPEGAGR